MSKPIKNSTLVNIKMDTEIFKMHEKYSKEAG